MEWEKKTGAQAVEVKGNQLSPHTSRSPFRNPGEEVTEGVSTERDG